MSRPLSYVRWCAKHKEGWCAVVPDRAPAEGSDGVPTLCEYVVNFPGGYDRREPTCADCLNVIARSHGISPGPAEGPSQ